MALDDDSIVAAGYVDGTWNGDASLGGQDFAAVKLLSNGTTVWSWRVSGHIEKSCVPADKTMMFRTGYV